MPDDVHLIVKNPQYFEIHSTSWRNSKEQDVPAAMTVSRHVQSHESRQKIVTLFDAGQRRTARQFIQRCQYDLQIGISLRHTKLF